MNIGMPPIPFINARHRTLRKCCGFVHLRAGTVINCLIWMGFSLYFAVLSFQNMSPFFSFMKDTAMLVFGVANLFMALMAAVCLVTFMFFKMHINSIRHISRFVWVATAFVVIDYIVNMIIFFTMQPQYISMCLAASSEGFSSSSQNTIPADPFNCNKMYQDEVKFSLALTVIIIVYYFYGALVVHSYYHKYYTVTGVLASSLDPMHMGQPHPVTPPSMPPPPMAHPPMHDQAQNIIVLHNTRPSSKTKSSGFPFRFGRSQVEDEKHNDIEKGFLERKPI